jgi:hypothetical protein
MVSLVFSQALEATLKNDQKFDTCILNAKDSNVKILVILVS